MVNNQRILRIWIALCLVAVMLLCVVSCEKEDVPTTQAVYYTVTFDSNGGSAIPSKRIPSGESIPDPGAPEREGYVFNGWMHNGAKWNFSTRKVREDLTLTAHWHTAETIFSYEVTEATQTARITKLKEKLPSLEVPAVIGGFPVTEIAEGVFANLYSSQVSRIAIPASVKTIGERAFCNSEGVEIVFDEDCQLIAIGEEAFSGCTGLQSISLGEGLTEIAAWCFSDCAALKEIRLPQSVTVIRENAFAGCVSLTTVTMYAEVDFVEDSAFEDCHRLRTLYCYGSEAEIETLLDQNTANMNDALQEATVYLYAEVQPSVEGAYGYWHWNEKGKQELW